MGLLSRTLKRNQHLFYLSIVCKYILLNFFFLFFFFFFSFILFSFILFKFLDRLVDHNALKRSLEECYANLQPKNSKQCLFVSIFIAPQNIDVNVHPTKVCSFNTYLILSLFQSEVHFLNEGRITDALRAALDIALRADGVDPASKIGTNFRNHFSQFTALLSIHFLLSPSSKQRQRSAFFSITAFFANSTTNFDARNSTTARKGQE